MPYIYYTPTTQPQEPSPIQPSNDPSLESPTQPGSVHTVELADSEHVIDIELDSSANIYELELAEATMVSSKYWSKAELVPMTDEDIDAITGMSLNEG